MGIKRNLAALFGSIVVSIINIVIFVYIPLVGLTLPLIITTSTLMFIGAYAAYPVIKKYMITPYYKDEEVFDEYDKILKTYGFYFTIVYNIIDSCSKKTNARKRQMRQRHTNLQPALLESHSACF